MWIVFIKNLVKCKLNLPVRNPLLHVFLERERMRVLVLYFKLFGFCLFVLLVCFCS
jgi:hypothetical protein